MKLHAPAKTTTGLQRPAGRCIVPKQPKAFSSTVVARSHVEGTELEDAQAVARRQVLAAPLLLSALALSKPVFAEEAAAVAVEAVAEPAAAAPAPPPPPPPAPKPAPAGQVAELSDEILAYKFDYPVATVSGKPLKMVLSHAPEKYSSAAPLTADARQRIVCELLDLRQFVSVSMTVGPASGVLKGVAPESWKPYDVALTVLIDRSTSRLTTGQRTALNDVEEAHKEVREGNPYWVYEHVSQGSPTLLESTNKETYRHALAATTLRVAGDGTPYLYTLNLSCRQSMWDDLQPVFKRAIDSFRLTTPGNNYVSPEMNPWMFW